MLGVVWSLSYSLYLLAFVFAVIGIKPSGSSPKFAGAGQALSLSKLYPVLILVTDRGLHFSLVSNSVDFHFIL